MSKEDPVLIADDDGTSRLILKRMVEGMGYDCDIVTNGQEAVAAAGRKKYKAIMMDMFMPVLSGCDAAASISQSMPKDQPCIVGMISIDEPDIKETCIDAGMHSVLCKPIEKKALRECLDHIESGRCIRQRDDIYGPSVVAEQGDRAGFPSNTASLANCPGSDVSALQAQHPHSAVRSAAATAPPAPSSSRHNSAPD